MFRKSACVPKWKSRRCKKWFAPRFPCADFGTKLHKNMESSQELVRLPDSNVRLRYDISPEANMKSFYKVPAFGSNVELYSSKKQCIIFFDILHSGNLGNPYGEQFLKVMGHKFKSSRARTQFLANIRVIFHIFNVSNTRYQSCWELGGNKPPKFET